jgi:membrane-associated phospholipid phosphatase
MRASVPRLGEWLLRSPIAVISAMVVVIGTALLLDAPVAEWASQLRGPVLDVIVTLINPIGKGVTLLAVCLVLTVLARRLGRARLGEAAWVGALAFCAAGLIEFGLKQVVGRPRPAAAGTLLGPEFDSFPSGHATSVFAVATALAASYPTLRWPLYALAAAIALGRVYLARHHLSDVIAGALIGVVIAVLILQHRAGLVAERGRAS